MIEECLIRLARVRADHEVPIYSGDPPEPIPADWIAISLVPAHERHAASYLLYILDAGGHIHECLEWETLRIAVDQAHELFGLGAADWKECLLPVPLAGPLDAATLEGAMAAR